MEPDLPNERVVEGAEALPQRAPEPTYAPFMLALGVTMLFWGLVTSPVMSTGGFAIFVWALWMWIRDIAQDWKN
ncbi:MAG: hypothetical protein ABSH22_14845 [Tepidisphaeraceae bacterium]|jgi:hypothetical protein